MRKARDDFFVPMQARHESGLTQRLRQEGYILCTEVARLVGVHKATVYRWVRNGNVEAISFNGAFYVSWESVRNHLGEIADLLKLDATI